MKILILAIFFLVYTSSIDRNIKFSSSDKTRGFIDLHSHFGGILTYEVLTLLNDEVYSKLSSLKENADAKEFLSIIKALEKPLFDEAEIYDLDNFDLYIVSFITHQHARGVNRLTAMPENPKFKDLQTKFFAQFDILLKSIYRFALKTIYDDIDLYVKKDPKSSIGNKSNYYRYFWNSRTILPLFGCLYEVVNKNLELQKLAVTDILEKYEVSDYSRYRLKRGVSWTQSSRLLHTWTLTPRTST